MEMSPEDLQDLKKAKQLLENPGMAARLTSLAGMPIQKGLEHLPAGWQEKVSSATREALTKALDAALLTLDFAAAGEAEEKVAFPRWHKIAATASGAAGGWFGLPALAIELPVSTMIILRSVADIGRAHGEDLASPEARLACLEVFAFGGSGKKDDLAESGYYGVRATLARSVTEAMKHLAKNGLTGDGAPALVRLIAALAARFEIQVSEKAAAMAIPVIGAFGGAVINYLFIEHFQEMSRGHFTVRRLERRYNPELVRGCYESL